MMTLADVADVLTAVSVGTGREIGETDVRLWHTVMGDVPKSFALEAVALHFRERPGVWLEPGHVVDRWRSHCRDAMQRGDGPLSIEASSETAPGGIGIEKRELKNGDQQFRFFIESDTGQAVCGLWRSTINEAKADAGKWRRRTA